MTRQELLAKFPYLTYFPFIGWFFPAILKKDDEFLIFHSKQAFLMAAYTAVVCSCLFLISGIINSPVVKLGVISIIYFHYAVYCIFCILGTLSIKKGEKKNLPIVSKYTNRFQL